MCMDLYRFIYGFTKLTLHWMVSVYRYIINKHTFLASYVLIMGLSLCSADYPLHSFNVLHLYSWVIKKHSLLSLFTYTHHVWVHHYYYCWSSLHKTINQLKHRLLMMYRKIYYSGCCGVSNAPLPYAVFATWLYPSCCILHTSLVTVFEHVIKNSCTTTKLKNETI